MTDNDSRAPYPPIPFVVGVYRSGTTLLRLMLDAHPDMAIPHETNFIPYLLRYQPRFLLRTVLQYARYYFTVLRHNMNQPVVAQRVKGHATNYFLPELLGYQLDLLAGLLHRKSQDDALRERFVKTVTGVRRIWDSLHLSEAELRQNLQAGGPFTFADGIRCLYRMYAQRFGKSRWGDKTPYYGQYMKAIETILPEARFVHIIRDGRDVALSAQKHIQLIGRVGDDMEGLARDWQWRVRDTRRQGRSCRYYLEVRYEELITDTTRVLQEVCRFIDLPYDSAMERYHETARQRIDELADVVRDGQWVRQVHAMTQSPPQPSRVGNWKKEMNGEDRARYEAVAGKTLRELGYETV